MTDTAAMLAAETAYDAARIALVEATERAFPKGSRVSFRFARNRVNYWMTAEVVGHGGSWGHHHAGYITIKNEASGATRNIHAAYHARSGELTLLNAPASAPPVDAGDCRLQEDDGRCGCPWGQCARNAGVDAPAAVQARGGA